MQAVLVVVGAGMAADSGLPTSLPGWSASFGDGAQDLTRFLDRVSY